MAVKARETQAQIPQSSVPVESYRMCLIPPALNVTTPLKLVGASVPKGFTGDPSQEHPLLISTYQNSSSQVESRCQH